MSMTEHRLFHIYIQPKDDEKENLDSVSEVKAFDFRIVAENPIEALTKMMAIEDMDYMYDPWNTKIVIEYEGIVY